MYAHQHTHTGRVAFMTFICVCFCLCVCCLCMCVCVCLCVCAPQPPSPCSVYFISYSLEFHFALFTKGRGAGGNGARKKRICYGQKNGSHIGGNALTTGNFFVLLCSFPLPIQPSAASPYLPPSLAGICSRRSQLARENTRAHTHARSIFRCWQFRRLLWQHVTGMRNNERRQLAKSYFKLESVTLRTVQMRTNNLPSSQRYFYCDSASFSVNTHRTRLTPPSPFRALVLALQLTPQRAATDRWSHWNQFQNNSPLKFNLLFVHGNCAEKMPKTLTLRWLC